MKPTPKNAGTLAKASSSRPAAKSSIAVRIPLRGPPSRSATQANGIPPSTVPGSPGTR